MRIALLAVLVVACPAPLAAQQYYYSYPYGWGYSWTQPQAEPPPALAPAPRVHEHWREMPRDQAYRWIIDQARSFCRVYSDYNACRRERRRR